MISKIRCLVVVTAWCGVVAGNACSDVFYPYPNPVTSVKVTYPAASFAFYPESNLIQGPGIGFDAAEPHEKLGGGAAHNWVTSADAGFPSDFIEDVGMPIIELDLGKDRLLSEISVWGYEDSNTNGMREFSLRFATDADGPTGYGTSIAYNPTFLVEDFFEYLSIERISHAFSEQFNARYIEMTVTDNYFDDPGDGTGENGWGAGGDRVGIGEIAFQAPDDFVPDPPDPGGIQFYEISDIIASTEFSDLYPAANLIQGPGVGFVATEPYSLLATGSTGLWVTEACGFPCDYLESFDPPELVIDLGKDVELNEINVWGYAATNANGVLEFELEFATEADGDNGFGTSVTYNPTFSDVDIDPLPRQQFPFDQSVTARYVKFKATDNYFEEPGDGTGELGRPAGGDRIGLGEIAFPIPTAKAGDFNGDGVLDAEDINQLVAESALGMNPPAYDLNSDNAVNFGDIEIWINDLFNSYVGDADLDGEFGSKDFVSVFIAGKYESGEPANWEEGDWSGDGVFNSGDFVVAFLGGGYELGPRMEAAAVPEPSSIALVLMGLAGLAAIRRRV